MSGQETLRFLTAAMTHLRDSGDFIGRKEFLAWGQEIVAAWNHRTPDPAQIRADALREVAQMAIDGLLPIISGECADAILALIDTPLSPTAVDGSPSPDAGGKEPCNECFLPANETCDICGAVGPSGKAGGKEGV